MKRIVFLQNGDFKDAYDRFSAGGTETYRDQRASVDFVAGLAPNAQVTTMAFGAEVYWSQLAPNLYSAGLDLSQTDAAAVKRYLDETGPTHLILRTPHFGFLKEAKRRQIRVLPVFADIFGRKGLRTHWRNLRLAQVLRVLRAPCFANHSLNASRSMHQALGLPRTKIVPWDWSKVPVNPTAKSGPADPSRPAAFFAGTMSTPKGVGDCLAALALLRQQGVRATMTFAGPGDLKIWRQQMIQLEVSDQVTFLGMIPNTQVRDEMRRHDFVIVPSRHNYPEGLPNTIYEGLASRSVLILSDHPSFLGRLKSDQECLTFKAANPRDLAQCIMRANQDRDLYQRVSRNAADAHDRLYMGLPWVSLISQFLEDPDNETGWVDANMLDRWDAP